MGFGQRQRETIRSPFSILDPRTAETYGSNQFISTKAERKNIERLSSYLSVFDRRDRTCKTPTDFEQKNWTFKPFLLILAETERQNIHGFENNFGQKTRTLPTHRGFLRKQERQNMSPCFWNFGQKQQTCTLSDILFRQRQKDRTRSRLFQILDRQTEHPSSLHSFRQRRTNRTSSREHKFWTEEEIIHMPYLFLKETQNRTWFVS